jgi:hypothetical protein
VRHVQEGEPDIPLDLLQLDLHLAAQLQVECAERLVEQEERGTVHHGAGQRHPLLLPAGELRRAPLREVVEFDEPERLMRESARVVDPAALQPECDVLDDRHVREERVALEHRVDGTSIRLGVRDVLAADQDATGCRFLESGDQAQRRRLAAARGAEQGEERSGRDRQIEVLDRGESREPLRDADELEVRSGLREAGRHCQAPRRTLWNAAP